MQVGVLVAPAVRREVGDPATDLPRVLGERLPGVDWQVQVVEDGLVDAGTDSLEVLEEARDRMLEQDWDLALVLTGQPLRDGRRALVTRASPVHRVGVLSVPALGSVHLQRRLHRTLVGVVGALVGHDPDREGPPDEDLLRRLHQLSTDVPERTGDTVVRFAARVLGGNLRLLLGMVRANHPLRLAVGLTRALTAAVAGGVLTLVTPDLWLLSARYSVVRLGLLSVIALTALVLAIVVGGGLWERARTRQEREQVALFNLATGITVLLGVATFTVVVLALSAAAVLLLVDPGVYAETAGHALGPGGVLRLAWLTAVVAVLGGALGAGLEDDDAVRAAAYTHQDAEVGAPRRGEPTPGRG